MKGFAQLSSTLGKTMKKDSNMQYADSIGQNN